MVNRDTVQLIDQQRLLRDLIRNICSEPDWSYWSERGLQGEYLHEFVDREWFLQHPLIKVHARVQAAKDMVYDAASEVNDAKDIGALPNVSKVLTADATFQAAAVQTHGGFGVAREYDAERFFGETQLTKLDPITQELTLNYIGENVLGLPCSY